MQTRALLRYIAALALGVLTLFPYFVFGGEVSSRQMMWFKLVIVAALLFSPVRLLGQPQFRLALVFCLPVAVISWILGFAESHISWGTLQVTAEPILCAWLGASLAWIVLRFLPLRA
jgi:hypothetical protein